MMGQLHSIYRSCDYYPCLKQFCRRLSVLVSENGFPSLDCTSVLDRLAKTLERLYLPDFVTTFDDWLDRVSVCESTDLKKHHHPWHIRVKGRSPSMDRLAREICTRFINDLGIFLFRFRKEYHHIRQTFGLPAITAFSEIEMLGGDDQTSSVESLLIRVGSHSLVYKTCHSGTEPVLNKICFIAGMETLCPVTLDRKTHLWQRYIENRPLSSPRLAPQVYKQYGHILAMIEQLNISDSGFDGFISDKNSVYFVKPERSFQYFFEGHFAFHSALLRTGLLPPTADLRPARRGDGHAPMATMNLFQSSGACHITTDGDHPGPGYGNRINRKKSHHYPYCSHGDLKFRSFLDDIISGYQEGHARLRQNRYRILALLDESLHVKPRYRLRTNSDYMVLMNRIIHAGPRGRARKRMEEDFEPLSLRHEEYQQRPEFLSYEKRCLSRYEMPVYYMDIHSCSLFTGEGEECENFFVQSPMEQIRCNFHRGANYAKCQSPLIVRAMNL